MDDPIPPFLTVEEASRLLKIGRTKAYDLTKEWRATGGRSGLPVIDLGDVLRVPGPAIEKMLGTGLAEAAPLAEQRDQLRQTGRVPSGQIPSQRKEPAENPPDDAPEERPADSGLPATPPAPTTQTRRPRRRPPDQLPLFQPSATTNSDPQTPSPSHPESTTRP